MVDIIQLMSLINMKRHSFSWLYVQLKLPYFKYNVEFPTLCLSDGSQMPNTWWISVFQLLDSNLGSLTFLYFLLLHYLRYGRLCSACSIVIYSEISDSDLSELTTTLLGRGSYFLLLFSSVTNHHTPSRHPPM